MVNSSKVVIQHLYFKYLDICANVVVSSIKFSTFDYCRLFSTLLMIVPKSSRISLKYLDDLFKFGCLLKMYWCYNISLNVDNKIKHVVVYSM